MNRIIARATLLVFPLTLCAAPVFAQSDAQRSADCSAYARNRVETEYPAGGGAVGGAVRGAAGGALIGVIAGGHHGAHTGAAVGAGVGVVGGAARAASQRDANYRYYYDQCMWGRR